MLTPPSTLFMYPPFTSSPNPPLKYIFLNLNVNQLIRIPCEAGFREKKGEINLKKR